MRKSKKILKSRIRAPAVQNSGYSDGGASLHKESMRSWHPRRLSAKSDIDANLVTLRNRAADQATNTPIGAAAVMTSVMNTVGAGLRLFPRIPYRMLGLSPDYARAWERHTAQEFRLWADSRDCDLFRRNNFMELQNIAYATYLTDGDSFALFRRKKPTPNCPYTLRLQLIEANRVSNPIGDASMAAPVESYGVEQRNPNNGNRIINGVEIDHDGALVAYWVSNRVPGDLVGVDSATTWQRIKAFGPSTGMPNILQVCHDERAEQYRGVPYLAPVLENLKQIGRYCNAELTSSIIRSFLSVFFTNTSSASNPISNILPDAYGAPPEDDGPIDVSAYHLGPGTLNSLPKGVDVKSIDSANAQNAYDSYMTHLEKSVSAALGIPYEVLFKNFNSSYSASRAALLQAQAEFKARRQWFATDFCQPVYEQWLMEAIASGRIEAPGYFDDPLTRKAWSTADWFGPAMSILDPVKDAQGSALRVAYGLSTREREAAEMTGTDFEDNATQLAYEETFLAQLGLKLGDPANLSVDDKKEEGEED